MEKDVPCVPSKVCRLRLPPRDSYGEPCKEFRASLDLMCAFAICALAVARAFADSFWILFNLASIERLELEEAADVSSGTLGPSCAKNSSTELIS